MYISVAITGTYPPVTLFVQTWAGIPWTHPRSDRPWARPGLNRQPNPYIPQNPGTIRRNLPSSPGGGAAGPRANLDEDKVPTAVTASR
jgi:hypothetical protein